MKILFAAAFFTLFVAINSSQGKSTLLTSRIIHGTESTARYVVPFKQNFMAYGAAALISHNKAITYRELTKLFPNLEQDRPYITVGSIYLLTGVPHYFKRVLYPTIKTSHGKVEDPNAFFSIIILENSIEPEPNVLYINLPEEDVNDGTECHVVGWGLTRRRKPRMSQILKELSVRILPDETCRTFFNSLSHTQICAKSSSGYAFKGDLGNPLVVRSEGNVYLVGILTTYSRNQTLPAVYMNLLPYRTFIETKLDYSTDQDLNSDSDTEACDSN